MSNENVMLAVTESLNQKSIKISTTELKNFLEAID